MKLNYITFGNLVSEFFRVIRQLYYILEQYTWEKLDYIFLEAFICAREVKEMTYCVRVPIRAKI